MGQASRVNGSILYMKRVPPRRAFERKRVLRTSQTAYGYILINLTKC